MFEPPTGVLDRLPDRAVDELPAEFREVADRLDPGVRKSLAWTVAISAEQQQLAVAKSRTRGARYTAVGFFNPHLETQDGRAFGGFGVIVYAEDPDHTGKDDYYTPPAIRHDPIEVLGVRFDVITRYGRFAQTASGTQPAGRVACWATARHGAVSGWLTARHCASTLGRVVDFAPDCTDAAIVSTGAGQTGSVRSGFQGLTAKLAVDLHLSGGTSPATVLDVSTDFGMLKSGLFPLRFSLDQAGVPGDSGSLLTEQATGDPLGIYLGDFTPTTKPGAQSAGIGLSIYQLEQMMDLEAYL